MPTQSKAAVLLGPRQIEIRHFPLPETGDDDGLLRIEITGVCGADWPPYLGERYEYFDPPLILGHEIVGRIEQVGARAAERWGVKPGDRVVVEEALPCDNCDACRSGHYMACSSWKYGSRSINVAPSLWGGYSEYLYLHPRSMLHKMADSVPVTIAPLFIPISNGIHWTEEVGGAKAGSTVLVLGPGPQGLGCVVGALEAGAATVIVVGLSKDEQRLQVAKNLGAHHVLRADVDDVAARVQEITNGKGADPLMNVTAGAPQALESALDLVADRGTIVMAGAARRPMDRFTSDRIWWKELTIKGVRGRYQSALKRAIAVVESGKYPLEQLCTHHFPIEETERALQTLGGQGEPNAIHVSVIAR
jgi:2-desacetyl-2-hydroxyethyl bacteriochlorophyllide A dehydrogenase